MRAAVHRPIDARLRGRFARRVAPAAAGEHDVRIALHKGERVELARTDISATRSDLHPERSRCEWIGERLRRTARHDKQEERGDRHGDAAEVCSGWFHLQLQARTETKLTLKARLPKRAGGHCPRL